MPQNFYEKIGKVNKKTYLCIMGSTKTFYIGPYVTVLDKTVTEEKKYKVHPNTNKKFDNNINFCPDTGVELVWATQLVKEQVWFNSWDFPPPLREDFFFLLPLDQKNQQVFCCNKFGKSFFDVPDEKKEIAKFEQESKPYLKYIASKGFEFVVNYGIIIYYI